MWQTINTQYVITIAVVTWAFLVLHFTSLGSTKWGFALYPLLGVLIGLSGPVIAGASVVGVLGLVVTNVLSGRHTSGDRLARLGLLVSGIIVAAATSHLSPGTVYRSTYFAEPSIDLNLARQLVDQMPGVLARWWTLLFSAGSIVTLILVAFLTYLLALLGLRPSVRALWSYSVGFLIFSWIMALVHNASTAFVYFGTWHLVQVGMFVWLGVAVAGIALGASLARLGRTSLAMATSTFVYATALGLAVASIGTAAGTVINRYNTWSTGPAPQSGIFDIEVEFLEPAWVLLRDIHGGPIREIDSAP